MREWGWEEGQEGKLERKGKRKRERRREKERKALNFWIFARAKCYLRVCNVLKITFSFQYFACDQSWKFQNTMRKVVLVLILGKDRGRSVINLTTSSLSHYISFQFEVSSS